MLSSAWVTQAASSKTLSLEGEMTYHPGALELPAQPEARQTGQVSSPQQAAHIYFKEGGALCNYLFQGLPGICALLTSQVSCLPQGGNALIHRELPLGSFHPRCQLLSPCVCDLSGPSSHRSHAVGKVHFLFIPGPSSKIKPRMIQATS